MNKKIKVLHIIKTLNLGGAEVNLLNLLRSIDQNKIELHVAYSFGGELEPKFKEAGIKLFKYAPKDNKVKSLATLGIVMRLVGYIKAQGIDIIHTHNFSAHLWGCMAAKLAGVKIIEHVHDFRYLEPDDFARRRGFNNQYKFIYKLKDVSDRVVVLTRQNRDFLIKEGIYKADRIREYQNGIPMGNTTIGNDKDTLRKSLINKFNLRLDALTILTPVRVAPEKNVDLILRIAPEVIKVVPNAIFLIAGDGPLYEESVNQIKKLELENNIKMIGYHPDITDLLKGTDVFLLPSFLELHSIAILEAMSMAVPVVISQDVGCNSEFIKDWSNGVLLDPFKDDGWANALIKLLQDPSLRKQIGNAGYQTCLEQFNIKNVAPKFEELYVSLC